MKAEPTSRRAIRIVSQCATPDEFVAVFSPYVERDALFVATGTPEEAGARLWFVMTLASGQPILRGGAAVLESHRDRSNLYGLRGMKLRFDELDDESRRTLRALETGPARRSGTSPGAAGGPARRAAEMLECLVYDEPGAEARDPALPASAGRRAPGASDSGPARSTASRPVPARPMAPATAIGPAPPPAAAAAQANVARAAISARGGGRPPPPGASGDADDGAGPDTSKQAALPIEPAAGRPADTGDDGSDPLPLPLNVGDDDVTAVAPPPLEPAAATLRDLAPIRISADPESGAGAAPPGFVVPRPRSDPALVTAALEARRAADRKEAAGGAASEGGARRGERPGERPPAATTPPSARPAPSAAAAQPPGQAQVQPPAPAPA